MSSGTTRLSDLIVPSVFAAYAQNVTEEKSNIIRSGLAIRDPDLDAKLAGEGLTFNVPSFKDLDQDAERISTDDPANAGSPNKIQTLQEIGVRLSRNNSWAAMDLAAALAGADPMSAIGDRVGNYWALRQQAALIATCAGIFADNDAAPDASEHVRYDMTLDISGSSYVSGTTNFSAEAFIDACTMMGDSQDSLGVVLVHSVVYGRMRKNNLIDFIPDSQNQPVATFLGRRVIIDDHMPNPSAGVYHTWVFGPGAFRLGVGTPKVPVETWRDPNAGNGSGQEVLFNRVEWMIHPVGYQYTVASPAAGGPSNASTSGNLAHAASFKRAFPERKQIKMQRLITRES